MELDNDDNVGVFKEEVRKFKKIENEIDTIKKEMKPLQDRIKMLKSEKKEIENEICLTLIKNDINRADIDDEDIHYAYQEKKAVVPITKNYLKDKIIHFFQKGPGSKMAFNSLGDTQKGEQLFEYVYGNREYNIKETLKKV